ncbi:MAG: N-acetylneuraminate synthase family protein [Elusimicrobia bacterium]|nr:N-acetylneuraminate synthase family protein [Elusimicrobiota bacterium]
MSEIDEIVKICSGKQFCLLVGFQAFPTPIEESNVGKIKFLRERYGCSVGYMDHSPAIDPFSEFVPCLAVGQGACCIEKHAYLKARKTLYDWQSAFDPSQFETLAHRLKKAQSALGTTFFPLSSSEQAYSRSKRKIIVAADPIDQGVRILPKNIMGRCAHLSSRTSFFTLNQSGHVVGRVARKNIQRFEVISPDILR